MTQFTPLPGTLTAPNLPQPQTGPAAAKPSSGSGFSFHDFLSIINPLQHLPVIGTLYRAITGDTIGTPEKIAGDTLYGGMWGAISSIADAAFQAVTGKDIGDTVLALFTGNHASKPVAAADAAPAVTPTLAAGPDITALTASLSQKGISSDIAQRAILAYQKSMTLPSMTLAAAR